MGDKIPPKRPETKYEQSYVKGIGFCAIGSDANSSVIDVCDGKIVRIRPLHYDWKYTREHINPWRIEVKGKIFEPTMKSLVPPFSIAYKKRVYSPNRILFPLKRVDWNAHGERNPQNRGISKYVRISWDEALDTIENEIKRIKNTYGMTAILSQSDGHAETKMVNSAHGTSMHLLKLLGGYTVQTRNADSWEGWYWGAKHVWGMEPIGQMIPLTNVIPDIIENGEMILFWGCDPETTPWGYNGQMASRVCYFWKEAGIKQIYICPDLNYGAAVHADKWIPILPNTDAALQLAIAYIWITEGKYDKEYVTTHTFGFEEFKQYVIGKEDGSPKTPQWAAQKTGVPSRIIKVLAWEWASKRTSIAHGNGGSYIRGPYSSEPGRLEVLLLAMQGVGKPGRHQVKMMEWANWREERRYPMPRGIVLPTAMSACRGQVGTAVAVLKNQKLVDSHKLPEQVIPKDLIPDALLNSPLSWYGNTLAREKLEDQFKKYTYPAKGCSEIHMIWSDSPSWVTCWNDGNSVVKAYRSPKIEFILSQHPWMENDCLYADIILPSNTEFEVRDIAVDAVSGQFHTLMLEDKCIEPLGESKSDYEITCLIAERFGLLEEYTDHKSNEDWIKVGFDESGVADLISWEKLKEKKYFVVPADPEWKKYRVGMIDFYENPEANPLKTPSGKIEFYSQNLAKYFPDDKERPPVPHWIEKSETHDERLSSERTNRYPLLIISNHPKWRMHSQHDDITWTREIQTCKVKGSDGYMYEPIWIHPLDAAKRGIQSGDIVKVSNERGAILGGALVWERIMPGVVYCDHGARYDPIVPGELDRGGAINSISPHNTTSKNATGMVTSGFLVEVEPVNIEEIREKYPEAFKGPYHPAAGLRLERVMQ